MFVSASREGCAEERFFAALPDSERCAALDTFGRGRYRRYMAQSILIFDFGTNEEAAQQARHKVDGWKQAFRLGDKMLLKFEREEPAAAEKDGEQAAAEESPKSAAKGSSKTKGSNKKASAKASAKAETEKEEKTEPAARVRVFVRLAFSDHEKLSYQRWLDRIPTEEPFKSAQGETVRSGQSEFEKTSEQFEALD